MAVVSNVNNATNHEAPRPYPSSQASRQPPEPVPKKKKKSGNITKATKDPKQNRNTLMIAGKNIQKKKHYPWSPAKTRHNRFKVP